MSDNPNKTEYVLALNVGNCFKNISDFNKKYKERNVSAKYSESEIILKVYKSEDERFSRYFLRSYYKDFKEIISGTIFIDYLYAVLLEIKGLVIPFIINGPIISFDESPFMEKHFLQLIPLSCFPYIPSYLSKEEISGLKLPDISYLSGVINVKSVCYIPLKDDFHVFNLNVNKKNQFENGKGRLESFDLSSNLFNEILSLNQIDKESFKDKLKKIYVKNDSYKQVDNSDYIKEIYSFNEVPINKKIKKATSNRNISKNEEDKVSYVNVDLSNVDHNPAAIYKKENESKIIKEVNKFYSEISYIPKKELSKISIDTSSKTPVLRKKHSFYFLILTILLLVLSIGFVSWKLDILNSLPFIRRDFLYDYNHSGKIDVTDKVLIIQDVLNKDGNNLKIDGDWRKNTRNTVKLYLKKHNIKYEEKELDSISKCFKYFEEINLNRKK